MKKFTLYWMDGKSQEVAGKNIADAMNSAGYGYGALGALDFYACKPHSPYFWDEASRKWEQKCSSAT